MADVKRFVGEGAAFVALAIVALVIVNAFYFSFYSKNDAKTNADKRFSEFLERENGTVQYLFFGDSHLVEGPRVERLPRPSFNYGTPGETYLQQQYRLSWLIEEDRASIGTLVLQIDLHTFSSYDLKAELEKDFYYYYGTIPWSDIKSVMGEEYPFLRYYVLAHFRVIGKGPAMLRVLDARTRTLLGLPAGDVIDDPTRHDRNLSTDPLREQKVAKKIGQHFSGKERIDERTFAYFVRTLAAAREHGIPVIFVRYPVSREYWEAAVATNVTVEPYYDRIFAAINETYCAGTTTTCPVVLDYHDLFFDRTDYFYDADHLNNRGQDAFTQRMHDDLERIAGTVEENNAPLFSFPART